MSNISDIDCYIDDGDKYTIKGRLLGACTKQEKYNIENDFKIAKRIFTKESVTVSSVIQQMIDISGETKGNDAGSVVIAIKTINKLESSVKRLMITSPLITILEEDINDDYSKIEAVCEDGSYLILKDVKNEVFY